MVSPAAPNEQGTAKGAVHGSVPEGATLVGRYRLGEQIGHGGMGIVYRADDQVLERQVAIKLLNPGLSDASTVERFRREALIAASLSHPGIAHVLDFAEDNGRSFIVMELLEGEDLGKLLAKEGTLDPQRAAGIAAQVAEALGHAHEQGAVHRDVKPGNIFLTRSGAVKVTDFGIATAAAQAPLTKTGEIIGTASYLSPEQVRGRPATGLSDLYALGCVLHEMLTGRPPFFAETSLATAMARLDSPAPAITDINPQLPKDLEAIVTKAMAPEPESRFGSAEQMGAALRATAAPRDAGVTAPIALANETQILSSVKAGVTKLLRPVRVKPESRSKLIAALALTALIILVLLTRTCGSGGGNEVQLPDLKSGSYPAAAKKLAGLGLKVARGPDQLSTEPAGQVFTQQPPAGSKVAKGSMVTIGVSSGKGVATPDLVNKSIDAAAGLLKASGLKGVIGQRVPGAQPGLIAAQDPLPGVLVAPGATIQLKVTEQTSSTGQSGQPGKDGERGKGKGHD